MVRTQLPWGQREPLGVEPETDCSSRLYAAMQSIGDSPILKQRRELRLKEAPLFFKVLFVMVLWPLLMIGWVMYWSGRK